MLIDVAALIGVFAAGYGLRAWMSTRRRQAIRKARGDSGINGSTWPLQSRAEGGNLSSIDERE